jgi:hypothetical protein
MKITTIFNIGDKVYIYTPSGLQLQTILCISVRVKETETQEYYYFEEYGNAYPLANIIADNPKSALRALESNKKAIQLFLNM